MGSISIADQMDAILKEVSGDVNKAMERALQKVPKRAAAKLRDVSPKNKGDYAKGWKTAKTANGVTVYNATEPALTHRLNNGHIVKNQYGQWGRVAGDKHINKVEEEFIDEFLNEVLNNLDF